MRLASLLVTLGVLAAAAAEAQVPDTTAADTGAFALPPIEVVGTIRPDAGPTIGSGVPVRRTAAFQLGRSKRGRPAEAMVGMPGSRGLGRSLVWARARARPDCTTTSSELGVMIAASRLPVLRSTVD